MVGVQLRSTAFDAREIAPEVRNKNHKIDTTDGDGKVWFIIDRRGYRKNAPAYARCIATPATFMAQGKIMPGIEVILLSDRAKKLSYRELIYRYTQRISFETKIKWRDA